MLIFTGVEGIGSKANSCPNNHPCTRSINSFQEAFTGRYFFSLSQKRITKNIKKVPGKKYAGSSHKCAYYLVGNPSFLHTHGPNISGKRKGRPRHRLHYGKAGKELL